MKSKRATGKGLSAAGWFYAQPGFLQVRPEPDSDCWSEERAARIAALEAEAALLLSLASQALAAVKDGRG